MRRLAFVFVLTVALSGTAWGDTIVDFSTGTAGVGGTVSWAGGSSPLVGTNILIGLLTASGAPANNGNHTVTGTTACLNAGGCGVLNFTTGSFAGYDASGNLLFSGPGTITLTGGVPDASLPNGTSLITTGSFNSATFFSSGAAMGSGNDTKNGALLAYFGIPASTPFTFFGFSIVTGSIVSHDTKPFSLSASSTDFKNTAVPEPATMALVGTCLLGLAGVIRRRMKK